MQIKAGTLHFKLLNEQIKSAPDTNIYIEDCLGQRYIGAGISNKVLHIQGTPGNALGAYLSGSTINVEGNAQDATGDTMDNGTIAIHGNCGDTTGYGMRGGKILVKGNAGYRVGIHMKEYEEHKPAIVIGGKVGDFLGEYQAGGTIVVLGIGCGEHEIPVGDFCGTGMHGGSIYIRTRLLPTDLPSQVCAQLATEEDLREIKPLIETFCKEFGFSVDDMLRDSFYKLTANSKNPYKQLYTQN